MSKIKTNYHCFFQLLNQVQCCMAVTWLQVGSSRRISFVRFLFLFLFVSVPQLWYYLPRGQKKVSYPAPNLGAGNQIWVPWKGSKCLKCRETSLQLRQKDRYLLESPLCIKKRCQSVNQFWYLQLAYVLRLVETNFAPY